MNFKTIFLAITVLAITTSPAMAKDNDWYFLDIGHQIETHRPDGHAPIGVMGDHLHHKGGFMASYRYMRMAMKGMRSGTNSLSSADVFAQGFMMSPTEMTMDMHMFGTMYAPTDFLTLMAMVPIVDKSMDISTMAGGSFSTSAAGLGDVKFAALVPIVGYKKHRVHLNLGLSTPTGSINKFDTTPMGFSKLPYPMQIGSGTWDLMPGLTYLGQYQNLSWGLQFTSVARLGNNSNQYRFGNQFTLNSWAAYKWNDWISNSLRVESQFIGNISGADSALNPNMTPTADTTKQGSEIVNLMVGMNFEIPKGKWWLKGHRIGIEAGLPVYQSLNGPQMERSWSLIVGWQKGFD